MCKKSSDQMHNGYWFEKVCLVSNVLQTSSG